MIGKCVIPDCIGRGQRTKAGKEYFTRGFCNKHYYRHRIGQPLIGPSRYDNRLATVSGKVAFLKVKDKTRFIDAMVDIADKHLESHKWWLSTTGYPYTNVKGAKVKLHKMIAGVPPKGMVTDHRDRNPLNNCRYNLRFITIQQNSINSSLRKSSVSGYKGVSFETQTKKWRATITHNQKRYSLGRFTSNHEAAKVYNAKATELHGNLAVLNQGVNI